MKISKSALQNALERVKPGLANREMIEQATSFAFIGGRVVTYNDEISISHPVEGLDVTGAVKAQALYDFLNKIKKDEINIKWEENQVIIKAGKSKAGLIFESEIKLPLDEEIGEIGTWQEVPGDFIDGLKFCYPCASKDMSRPILTCVNVQGSKIQASDSYQIISYVMDSAIISEKFLIPATAVKELVKYDITELSTGDSWVHFRTADGTVFSTRTINNDFPEVSKHMEIREGVDFTFPEDTNDILQRAQVFSKKENSPGDIPTVTVEIGEQKLLIKTQNESGWFEESGETEYEGNTVKFTVGIDFMLALFSKLQTCVIGKDKIGFSGENWDHVVAILAEEEE